MIFATTREFVVTAVPVAQPRARATVGASGHARMYEAKKGHPIYDFKAQVRLVASPLFDAPLLGPVRLDLTFVLPRPKRLIWKTRAMPRAICASGKDIDNLQKSVQDALNGIAWKDDAQIAVATTGKVFAAADEKPGVHVRIREIVENHQSRERKPQC